MYKCKCKISKGKMKREKNREIDILLDWLKINDFHF